MQMPAWSSFSNPADERVLAMAGEFSDKLVEIGGEELV
jgi:hypothetical protein